MKFLVQRVKNASVSVDEKEISKIDNGFLVFIGIGKDDTLNEADYLVNKLLNLRIFEDENMKMNKNIMQVNGSLLLVSQFTLYADTTSGNRPSFTNAKDPKEAKDIYEYVIKKCKEKVENVKTGIFGADMKVSLLNDGPVTIMLER